MHKNYFTCLLKKYRIALIFFLVLSFALAMTPFIDKHIEGRSLYSGSVGILAGISAMLAYVLPVLLFSFVHRRSSADQYLALPISRKQHLITSLVFAFAASFGIFFVSSIAIWLIRAADTVSFLRVLAFNGAAAAMIALLLCVNTCWFLIANNVFDGIVMIGAYTALPLLVTFAVSTFTSNVIAGGHSMYTDTLATCLSPLALGVRNFSALMDYSQPLHFSIGYNFFMALWFALACYGLYIHFIRRKSERAQQLSDDPLAYRLIINTYAAGILLILSFGMAEGFDKDILFLYPLLLFIYATAQFVYHRKIQITAKILITFAALTAFSFAFTSVAWATHGFTLADRYQIDVSDQLNIRYSATVRTDHPDQLYDYEEQNYDGMQIEFSLAVPVKDLDRYREVTDLLDTYRKQAISDYYKKNNPDVNCTLYYNNSVNDNYGYENSYVYRLTSPISLSDLKLISRYTPVTLTSWETGDEILLEDYLKGK